MRFLVFFFFTENQNAARENNSSVLTKPCSAERVVEMQMIFLWRMLLFVWIKRRKRDGRRVPKRKKENEFSDNFIDTLAHNPLLPGRFPVKFYEKEIIKTKLYRSLLLVLVLLLLHWRIICLIIQPATVGKELLVGGVEEEKGGWGQNTWNVEFCGLRLHFFFGEWNARR